MSEPEITLDDVIAHHEAWALRLRWAELGGHRHVVPLQDPYPVTFADGCRFHQVGEDWVFTGVTIDHELPAIEWYET